MLQGEGCSACTGGQGSYTESYSVSGNAPGVNSWQNKTVETEPDGNQNISYYKSNGQLMLSVFGSRWLKSRGRCLRLRAGLFVVETCPYLAAILLRLDASIPARIRGASDSAGL